MRVHASTALGEVGDVRLDTIELHRGGMLLIVATSSRHVSPAPEEARDGLHEALFVLRTPNFKHHRHAPNNIHLNLPPLPHYALGVAGVGR